MRLASLPTPSDDLAVGQDMHEFIAELYPICRSITGNGVRKTLEIIARRIDVRVHEVPTGTPVFDWTVPREWNIREAYIEDLQGRRVVDFKTSNLHVLNYSIPVSKTITLDELRPHLFTLPEQPDLIPYRTSYYTENWGFCLSHNDYLKLSDDRYRVVIDSTLENGSLTYGECYLKGETLDEVLISSHICHPSLCNDNLSGIAIATYLARAISLGKHRYSYRFLFIPGTIGAITWLARNDDDVHRVKHGLVLTCLGDPGSSTYKRSRRGNAEIDVVMEYVLKQSGGDFNIVDFSPYGYDERQFCSPGFNLPIGCFMRTPHGCFPQYHTSADDLQFVHPDALVDSLKKCQVALDIIDSNGRYLNLNPNCEPQLGKRGLYRPIGGQGADSAAGMALLWVLNLSDGDHTLLDIARRSQLDYGAIREAADTLTRHGLLAPAARKGARA